jgi:hypothetical protein
MTRRVVKPQPDKDDPCIGYCTDEGFPCLPEIADEIWAQTEEGESIELKNYSIGDHLWVRETWGINGYNNQDGHIIFVRYKAGGHDLEIDLDDEALWERYADQEAKWYENHDEKPALGIFEEFSNLLGVFDAYAWNEDIKLWRSVGHLNRAYDPKTKKIIALKESDDEIDLMEVGNERQNFLEGFI